MSVVNRAVSVVEVKAGQNGAAHRRPFARRVSDRAGWPYANPEAPLPATMPDGSAWPKISVVTPSYNQGRYIEQTILSVRNQGYPDVEHILMDGGSKDETMDVVQRYRDGFAVAISEKDKGQSDAINKGMNRATGELLTWINSDDMLAPGALAAAALAWRMSGADFITGICRIHKDGQVIHQCITSCAEGPMPLSDLLDLERCWFTGQFWWQPDCLFTRDLWERAGAASIAGIDGKGEGRDRGHVRVDWYYSMDYELWLRMAEVGARVKAIGRPVCLYRSHEAQKTEEEGGGGFRSELPHVVEEFKRLRRIGEGTEARGHGGTEGGGAGRSDGGAVGLQRPDSGLRAPEVPATKPKLKVVSFSDIGFTYGAGIAQKRIMAGFGAAGHEVIPLAAASVEPTRETPRVTAEAVVKRIGSKSPDLVVVGNLHGSELDPVVLGAITRRFQTAFVLHDQWLLSGRCAYPGPCEQFKTGCGDSCTCPGSYPPAPEGGVDRAWEAKRRIIREGAQSGKLCLLTNSRHVLDTTREALIAGGIPESELPPMDWIKYGLDTEQYRPRDPAMCREQLGLPQDRFIIMASSSSLDDERKGLAHLRDALGVLGLEDVLVVAVGWFNGKSEPPIPGMRAMGYLKDPRKLAMLYSAADVFVGPSLEEAFGQVYVEAAACGTPSIGYPVGGVPEALADGVSGRLAAEVSPGALAGAIDELYTDGDLRRNLGRWGRVWAQSEHSTYAAFHRMHTVLRGLGVGDRIGLSRKINFTRPRAVPEPSLVMPETPGYRVLWGLEHWEGPRPEKGLGRFRWSVGPSCGFEFQSDRAGAARLIVGCRNTHEGQRVRLMHGGKPAGERPVPVTGDRDHMVVFDVKAGKGINRFELHHWKWAQSGRKHALMVTGLNLVR